MPASRPCDPLLRKLLVAWSTGAVGGLFFGMLLLAFDVAGLAELVIASPGAVLVMLPGAMCAFLPVAITGSMTALTRA